MDRDDDADEDLMQQAAYGASDAMHVLVRRYGVGLLTFLHRMINDRDRAEELFQEVFLAVWEGRKRYEYPRPFRAWLFGIAEKKCLAEFRRSQRTPLPWDPQADPLASSDPLPDDLAIAAESAQLLADAVTRLPYVPRTVLVLRVWNDLSYLEIAETLGCREGTVRSHMCHALAMLRKLLAPRLT